MIDEPKQDLLVQYLLGELDPSMADKVRAELEARRRASGVCARNGGSVCIDGLRGSADGSACRAPSTNSSGGTRNAAETLRQRPDPRSSGWPCPGRWQPLSPLRAPFLVWSGRD